MKLVYLYTPFPIHWHQWRNNLLKFNPQVILYTSILGRHCVHKVGDIAIDGETASWNSIMQGYCKFMWVSRVGIFFFYKVVHLKPVYAIGFSATPTPNSILGKGLSYKVLKFIARSFYNTMNGMHHCWYCVAKSHYFKRWARLRGIPCLYCRAWHSWSVNIESRNLWLDFFWSNPNILVYLVTGSLSKWQIIWKAKGLCFYWVSAYSRHEK